MVNVFIQFHTEGTLRVIFFIFFGNEELCGNFVDEGFSQKKFDFLREMEFPEDGPSFGWNCMMIIGFGSAIDILFIDVMVDVFSEENFFGPNMSLFCIRDFNRDNLIDNVQWENVKEKGNISVGTVTNKINNF
ncbi:hypothetical protein LIER_01042 [Lithospermum erythrorhizon]|uniref:Uncharacterized protein n=1 Tax=Lithospermum erythrorhizon TaxID=34254 RepID=A0AAV3NJJ5_LITER